MRASWNEIADWDASPEVIVMLTVVRANEAELGFQRENQYPEQGQFDRSVLALPEVEFEDSAELAEDQLKPLFDLVYQSAGFERSPNFNAEGKWTPVLR